MLSTTQQLQVAPGWEGALAGPQSWQRLNVVQHLQVPVQPEAQAQQSVRQWAMGNG